MLRLRNITLAMIVLLLTACSSTTFLYNRLDFIIPWYLDDYVDLNKAQRSQLDGLLAPFLEWHRSEELPRYRDILDDMIANLDQPATPESVAQMSANLEQAWFRLEAEAVEWLLALGEELEDAQIEEFLAELAKSQKKYEKKYLDRDDEEYREELYDSFKDSAQDFLGRLDWGQRALLETASGNMQRSDDAWLSERAEWIEQMRQYLRREPGWQQAVRDGLATREESVSPEYRETFNHNLAVINQLVADVLNSRSEKQDARLRKKLNGFREDLDTLIAQED